MKRFIQNLLVFFGLLVLGMFGMIVFKYFVIGSQYKYSYVASFYDKIERLESINEPKIILVGNSNLAFGMNSEKLEKSMGMPVVNLGLHNNLGSAFHEQMAKFNINKGDIVEIGKKIGVVGEVPSEISEKPHLHFEVEKDGAKVNPIKELELDEKND